MRKKKWKSLLSVIIAGMLMMNNPYSDIVFASSENIFQETVKEISENGETNTNTIPENATEIKQADIWKTDITDFLQMKIFKWQ